MFVKPMRFPLLLGALLAVPTSVMAATYTAGISGQTQVSNSPNPITLNTNFTEGFGNHIEGTIIADSPLRGEISCTGSSGIGGSAFAVATFDNVILSPLPGQAADPFIDVTLHLPFDAIFHQQWQFLDYDGGTTASSFVDQRAAFSAGIGTFFGGSPNAQIVGDVTGATGLFAAGISGQNNFAVVPGPSPGPMSYEGDATGSSDPLFAFTISHNIQLDDNGFLYLLTRELTPITSTNPVGAGFIVDDTIRLFGEMLLSGTAPVNTPLTLQLSISELRSRTGGNFSAFGDVDALHTFGLPVGTPVFDLPDGYTANSPELGLVNNFFVPEPTSAVLVGLVLLSIRTRRYCTRSV